MLFAVRTGPDLIRDNVKPAPTVYGQLESVFSVNMGQASISVSVLFVFRIGKSHLAGQVSHLYRFRGVFHRTYCTWQMFIAIPLQHYIVWEFSADSRFLC